MREERDPSGAELPLENPYGYAESYVDWKSSQPLFIEGGDPFDYSSGRTIDGLPVSEAEFQRRTGSGSVGAGVFIGGKFGGFIDLSGLANFSYVTVAFDIYRSGQETPTPDFWYYLGTLTQDFKLNSGQQTTFKQHTTKPQKPMDTGEAERILTESCIDFLNSILAELGKVRETYSSNFSDIFKKAKDSGHLYSRQMTPEQLKEGLGGVYSTVGDPNFYLYLEQTSFNQTDLRAGYNLIHDLFHAAASAVGVSAQFNHTEMARAAYSVAMSNPVLKKQLMNTSHAGPVKNVSYTQKGFNKGDD